MRVRAGSRTLLASVAAAALGAALALPVAPARAQPAPGGTVAAGGALDLTISGFARFLATGGQLRDKGRFLLSDIPSTSGNFDFRNDTELHVFARGRDESTGLEYGATIEFEADINGDSNLFSGNPGGNTDETWIFVRGGFGELRFGDVDGPEEAMKAGAYSVAVGSGGLDGEVVGSRLLVENANLANDDATKIVYYTPTLAGFQAGLAFTPDDGAARFTAGGLAAGGGDTIKVTDDVTAEDIVSGGLAYTNVFGDLAVKASVVGRYGHLDTRPENPLTGEVASNVDDIWTVYGGFAATYGRFSLAGGIGKSQGPTLFGIIGFPLGTNERTYYNLGVSAQFERFAVSFNYGFAEFEDAGGPFSNIGDAKTRVQDFILGVEVGLLPGVALSAELEYWRPLQAGGIEPTGSGNALLVPDFGDDAVIGLVRLAVAF